MSARRTLWKYVQAPEEPMLDPKMLGASGRTSMVVPVPPPVRKINSKGTAVLNARRTGNRGKSERRLKTTPVLG